MKRSFFYFFLPSYLERMKNEDYGSRKKRLQDINYRTWGPYVSNRQWGNVREDYSNDGNTWEATGHDDAESRTYRWAEEGIAGISDENQLFVLLFLFGTKKIKW
jgi:hypothetical protein